MALVSRGVAKVRPPGSGWKDIGTRWLKFNTVGGIGIGVQLLILAGLKSVLHLDYLAATACAVEAAILHNFFWHERFTWVDRARGRGFTRLFKFNLTTGMVSLAGNLLLMRIFVGAWHIEYLVANCIVISVCSLFNFVASDRFVFRTVE
jgi:putative flippase GtrA